MQQSVIWWVIWRFLYIYKIHKMLVHSIHLCRSISIIVNTDWDRYNSQDILRLYKHLQSHLNKFMERTDEATPLYHVFPWHAWRGSVKAKNTYVSLYKYYMLSVGILLSFSPKPVYICIIMRWKHLITFLHLKKNLRGSFIKFSWWIIF